MSEDDFNEAIAPYTAVQLIVGLATIATFIVTTIWMYRLATNVRAFRRDTTWSPLFAIFGWMLPPIVLYVIPFLMLRELWKASDRDRPGRPRELAIEPRHTARLGMVRALRDRAVRAVPLLDRFVRRRAGSPRRAALESLAESLDDFGAVQ